MITLQLFHLISSTYVFIHADSLWLCTYCVWLVAVNCRKPFKLPVTPQLACVHHTTVERALFLTQGLFFKRWHESIPEEVCREVITGYQTLYSLLRFFDRVGADG